VTPVASSLSSLARIGMTERRQPPRSPDLRLGRVMLSRGSRRAERRIQRGSVVILRDW